VTVPPLRGARLLVTGATGAVGFEVARTLAADNEVWGLARYRDPAARDRVAAAGIRPVAVDFDTATPATLADVLPEVDDVLHFAANVGTESDFDQALRDNADPAALLMAHYRDAVRFLHCSSTAVYHPAADPRREQDALGEYMRPVNPSYSVSKIAGEAVVRSTARITGTPTTIARLNVPYGDGIGLPAIHLRSILAGQPVVVRADDPNRFAPLHTDDIARTAPALLAVAGTPPTVVNWAGDEPVGVREWSAHLGGLTGREVTFLETDQMIGTMLPDVDRLRSIVGGPLCAVGWEEGFRRMVAATGVPAA